MSAAPRPRGEQLPFSPVPDQQLLQLSNHHAREACRRLVGGWNDGLDINAAHAHAEQALALWYAHIDRVISVMPWPPTNRDFGHDTPRTE